MHQIDNPRKFFYNARMAQFIIKKKVGAELLARAEKVPVKRKLNSKTIMDEGEGQLTGAVGELMMMDLFRTVYEGQIDIEHANTYDYDIVLDDRYRLDVKSKRRGVAPRTDYNATVADYSLPIQICHAYYFTSITFTDDVPTDFYFLGYLSKQKFRNQSTFGKKGDQDGGNKKKNGKTFVFTADCWNVHYGDLDMLDGDKGVLQNNGFEIVYW